MAHASTLAAAIPTTRSGAWCTSCWPTATDIDLVVAKWKWEADVIERSEPVSISGVQVRVPRTRDLILLKLAAGGYADLQDAAALLAVGDADTVIPDVEAHIRDVRPDVRAL
jgi:hypothetical protein